MEHRPERQVVPVTAVRDVRVLLVNGARRCRIRLDSPFEIRTRQDEEPKHFEPCDWTELRGTTDRKILLGDRLLGPEKIRIVPARGQASLARWGGNAWAPPHRYSGSFIVTCDNSGNLDVINRVDIETYVACVLPGEIYPNFHLEAYRAQAVAARTYVLYQMAKRDHKPYDVLATEASQVYVGLQNSGAAERARLAVNDTRAIVASWASPEGERVFCTYYSACCGGMTQDVNNCKPADPSIPPLAGNVRCDYCKIAPSQIYRWKPVRLSKSEITARLVARYPELNKLGRLRRLEIVERTDFGRPKVFRFVGARGESRSIIAEDLRLSIGSRTLKSTQFRMHDEGESIRFTEGRGFGHAMGMCQWGMQGMALKGFTADEILKFYYPTMHLTRAY